jgi:hypothetical protein
MDLKIFSLYWFGRNLCLFFYIFKVKAKSLSRSKENGCINVYFNRILLCFSFIYENQKCVKEKFVAKLSQNSLDLLTY